MHHLPPMILICAIYGWSCNLGAAVAIHAFWATDLLLFRNPREDFKVVHRRSKEFGALSQEKENKESVWKESYPERFAGGFGGCVSLLLVCDLWGAILGMGPMRTQ
jgi:hypothetical protein